MLSKIVKISLICFFCISLIAIPMYALLQRVAINQKAQSQSQLSTGGKPLIPVTDLAPQLPSANKSTLTIKHSDSTFEKVVMPKTMVSQYSQNLPKGDIIVTQQ